MANIKVEYTPNIGLNQISVGNASDAAFIINGNVIVSGSIDGTTTPYNNLFVFSDGATRDGNLYGNWEEMMNDISQLPTGIKPKVRLANTGSYTVPSTNMPVSGWNFKNGTIEADYKATGLTVCELLDGVFFDNFAGVDENIVLKIQPGVLSPNGVFQYSESIDGIRVFTIANGAALDHSTTSNPAIVTPGIVSATTMVVVMNQSQQGMYPLSGSIVYLSGDDACVSVQINCGSAGGIPDNWVSGGSASSGYIDLRGIDSRIPSVPSYTGSAPVVINSAQSYNLIYNPANLTDWSGVAPTSTANALDRIAAMIGPIP